MSRLVWRDMAESLVECHNPPHDYPHRHLRQHAARGPKGRTFPWGEAMPSTELAVINRPSGDIIAVGSRPKGATPEGLLDMAGSLLEWTSSLLKPYPYRADDGREDPAAPGERAVRGGNYVFDDAPERLTGWNRTVSWRSPATGHRQIGVRCAAD
ncbi:MAG TPA: SUMF1/EgtB/PvdO family nonheme iron enzyme [Burkholderiales bacterium]